MSDVATTANGGSSQPANDTIQRRTKQLEDIYETYRTNLRQLSTLAGSSKVKPPILRLRRENGHGDISRFQDSEYSKDLETRVWQETTDNNISRMVGYNLEPIELGSREYRLKIDVDGDALVAYFQGSPQAHENDNEKTGGERSTNQELTKNALIKSFQDNLSVALKRRATANTAVYYPIMHMSEHDARIIPIHVISNMADEQMEDDMKKSKAKWAQEWSKMDGLHDKETLYRFNPKPAQFAPNKKTHDPIYSTEVSSSVSPSDLRFLATEDAARRIEVETALRNERESQYKNRQHLLLHCSEVLTDEAVQARKVLGKWAEKESAILEHILKESKDTSDSKFETSVNVAPVTYSMKLGSGRSHDTPSTVKQFVSMDEPVELTCWFSKNGSKSSSRPQVFASPEDLWNNLKIAQETEATRNTAAAGPSGDGASEADEELAYFLHALSLA